MTRRGSITIQDQWGGYPSSQYADEVDVTEHETHSRLLGPDGRPLAYDAPPRLGFDLTPRAKPKKRRKRKGAWA